LNFGVTVRPVVLPDGPRGAMARSRSHDRFALLESALPMPRQAQWSYVAGPAVAILYTDETCTRLELDGRQIASWADPIEALAAVANHHVDSVSVHGDCPDGFDFVGGWVGVLGYDLGRKAEPWAGKPRHDPALPRQWWMAVDRVLAFHHPTAQWCQTALASQIVAELRKDLLLRGVRWQRRGAIVLAVRRINSHRFSAARSPGWMVCFPPRCRRKRSTTRSSRLVSLVRRLAIQARRSPTTLRQRQVPWPASPTSTRRAA